MAIEKGMDLVGWYEAMRAENPVERGAGETSSLENFDGDFYIRLVEGFVQTGEIAHAEPGDPIYDYLYQVMSDPEVKALVLSSRVAGRIFADNMMRFVDCCLQRKRFGWSRKQSEYAEVGEAVSWSERKKADGFRPLINKLGDSYSRYGFQSGYFEDLLSVPERRADDNSWRSLFSDYQVAFKEYLRDEVRKEIGTSGAKELERVKLQMDQVPKYLDEQGISEQVFSEAWAMMGGAWNVYDFKKYSRFAIKGNQWPAVERIARLMGRTLDLDGKERLWMGSGATEPLRHASRSDIEGITLGGELSGLLPMEQALMQDDGLYELFLRKYTTGKLQRFMERSDQMHPARKLRQQMAKPKGPMIVCLDTSGSMKGWKQELSRSVVVRLNELAIREKRALFVIAFSVFAKPIDARRDRNKLLDLFSELPDGNTDGTRMLTMALDLLERHTEYINADVLFVTDFLMDRVAEKLVSRLHEMQREGTRFYGLQAGENPDNQWADLLDSLVVAESAG